MLRAVQVFIVTADPSLSAQGVHTASWTHALTQTLQTPQTLAPSSSVWPGSNSHSWPQGTDPRKEMQPNAPFVIGLLNCYEHLSDLSGVTAPITCWPLVNLSHLLLLLSVISTHSSALIHANFPSFTAFYFISYMCMYLSA